MESAFRLPPSEPRGTREYAPRYSADEWDAVRPRIQQLYVTERATLEQVMRILQDESGFCASEKQLKSRIAKWGFDVKNVKGSVMFQMARKRVKRMRDHGKKSVFLVGKQVVSGRKINRFLKRNDVSEEALLSMSSPLNAPSPAFMVFTPRPESLLEFGAEIAHSTGDNTISYTSHNELPSFEYSESLITTNSHLIYPGTRWLWSSIPKNIQDRPESPEVLLWHFRERICPMLAMADGKNNMWQILVLPLVHNSDTLYQAIAAMTALHISAGKHNPSYEAVLMGRSVARLRSELQSTTPSGATLATILILAYWARWTYGSNAGKMHVDGAVAALRLLQSPAPEVKLRNLPDDKCALLNLLSDTCVYMESLSQLISAATAVYGYTVTSEAVLEDYFEQTLQPTPHPADPWMYCAGGLYPLMNRAANLFYASRTGSSHIFPAVFENMVSLKFRLESWVPNKVFGTNCRVHVSVIDAECIVHTAEAYRYATILYLQRAIPGLPGLGPGEITREVFNHLSVVPSSSTITFVQIFPLFVAGCEASTVEDRRWVEDRWKVMLARMKVKNISKCWDITREVWRRRDNYHEQRDIRTNCLQKPKDDSMDEHSRNLRRVFSVGGRLHWASVLSDLGWEISF